MSDTDENLAPCLLFVAHAETITDSVVIDPETVNGYALLPPNLNNEGFIHEVFSRNGVQIIQNAEGCPRALIEAVKDKRVEAMEIFLEDRTPAEDGERETSLENSFCILVECWNELLVPAVFSNDEGMVQRDDGMQEPCISNLLCSENVKVIEYLVNCSPDIQFRTESKPWSLLHFAVAKDHKPFVELLLKNGVDINVKTFGGTETPLHTAIHHDLEPMVDFLLQEGADVQTDLQSDSNAETISPLCLALMKVSQCNEPAHCRIIERLLDKGADVNAVCKFGSTLHLAIKTNNSVLLSSVLRHRPDLNSKVNREAFQEALKRNNKEMIDLLRNYGFKSDPDNLDPFFEAISLKNIKAVKKFVKKRFDVNHYCSSYVSKFYGMRPLHLTVENFLKEISQLLLDYGVDITAKSIHGTPLFHAVKVRDVKAIEFLILKGVRVQDDPLILHTAIEAKAPVLIVDKRCGSVSLRKYPDLDARNEGKTAAAVVPIVELCLKHGARFDTEHDSFKSSLMGHVHLGNQEVVEVLLKHKFEESDVIEAMIRAILADSKEILVFLLKYGGHLLPEKFGGRSVLEQSLKQWFGCPSVFSTLLSYCYLKLKLISESGVTEFISRELQAQESDNFQFDLGLDDGYFHASYGQAGGYVAKHVRKIKEAKLRINQEDSIPEFSPWMEDFDTLKSDCKSEIKRLKNTMVGNSCISFYNILDADAREISHYLRNNSVVNVLKAYNQNKKKFPLYWDIIDAQFQKGFYRKSLMNRCISSFDFLSEKSSELPRDIKEIILDYLTNPHLLIFSNIRQFQLQPKDANTFNA